jgi:hypothetical protein
MRTLHISLACGFHRKEPPADAVIGRILGIVQRSPMHCDKIKNPYHSKQCAGVRGGVQMPEEGISSGPKMEWAYRGTNRADLR